ncbi:MAG: undecaprenyldiphospho-muramoylpentapeptide beta-N-acetylglucosaminyltransferase [Bacillota bacterium]|nr:undecaprenyldiphospho-muramoylpentapeptide beta-N-acetylglucosaminyltransferase [Bacillota bacterium]
MKVIMSGGGTGGHIYPAIAIADKIKRKHPEAEILFVGTEKGLERELVPQNGYPIRFITVSGVDRKHLLRNFKTARDLLAGSAQARDIIEEFRPELVVGTGGYVCGPVIRAAHKAGIPTYIHEQNAVPGMTNKLLERYVEKVFISFPEAAEHFRRREKLVVTGNPIRKSFLTGQLCDHRAGLGIGEREFFVLCFGGSRGAGQINAVMTAAAGELLSQPGLRLCFITGKAYYEEIKRRLEAQGTGEARGLLLLPYAGNIHEYLSAADLVISRSGALTVAEITACGKASILIPSPNVTGNHQYFNAKVAADRGGALIIEEKELSPEKLTAAVLRLKKDREALNAMGRASRELGRLDAADVIYDHLGL